MWSLISCKDFNKSSGLSINISLSSINFAAATFAKCSHFFSRETPICLSKSISGCSDLYVVSTLFHCLGGKVALSNL